MKRIKQEADAQITIGTNSKRALKIFPFWGDLLFNLCKRIWGQRQRAAEIYGKFGKLESK